MDVHHRLRTTSLQVPASSAVYHLRQERLCSPAGSRAYPDHRWCPRRFRCQHGPRMWFVDKARQWRRGAGQDCSVPPEHGLGSSCKAAVLWFCHCSSSTSQHRLGGNLVGSVSSPTSHPPRAFQAWLRRSSPALEIGCGCCSLWNRRGRSHCPVWSRATLCWHHRSRKRRQRPRLLRPPPTADPHGARRGWEALSRLTSREEVLEPARPR